MKRRNLENEFSWFEYSCKTNMMSRTNYLLLARLLDLLFVKYECYISQLNLHPLCFVYALKFALADLSNNDFLLCVTGWFRTHNKIMLFFLQFPMLYFLGFYYQFITLLSESLLIVY